MLIIPKDLNSKCAQAAQNAAINVYFDFYNDFHLEGMCDVPVTIIISTDVEKTSLDTSAIPDDNPVPSCDIKRSSPDNDPLNFDQNIRTIALSFASVSINRKDNAKHKDLDDAFIFQLNSLLPSDDTDKETSLEFTFDPVFDIISPDCFHDNLFQMGKTNKNIIIEMRTDILAEMIVLIVLC